MRFMKLDEVTRTVGLGRSSVYKQMAAGTFPRSVCLGGRSVAWVSDEIDAWMQTRIDERDGEGLHVPDTSTG